MAPRVVVVGAGMAGLAAAQVLVDHAVEVVVLDKGRAPGGRMASRRVSTEGDGPNPRFDHGAQFLTAKSSAFREVVDGWVAAGVAATWFRGGPDASGATTDPAGSEHRPVDGHPRHRGVGHMRAIPEHLAAGLDVRLATVVAALVPAGGRWRVVVDGGPDEIADAVVVTAPSPQARALFEAGGDVPRPFVAPLDTITWDPAWAVLVRPAGPFDLPGPAGAEGALRLQDHPVEWIADNVRKGVSPVPAVTIHASASRTRQLLDASPHDAGRAILADAEEFVTGEVLAAHRWRYSSPSTTWHEPTVLATDPAPAALAGDAFSGGRVEGAWTSGRAAGEAIVAMLSA